MTRYIGLDLHKRVLEVCILDQGGHVEARMRLPVDRDSLASFAKSELRLDDRVAVEATTNTWPVVELLRSYVADVTVSNPMATKAIAQAKVKTDKIDARMLAQLLRADFLPSVWQPDADTSRLRQLTNQRASLVADRISIKNRIHAVLHQRLIPPPSARLFNEHGRQWLDQLEIDPDGRAALRRDLHLLDELEHAVAEVDRMLFRLAGEDPRIKLLITLPGVDVACAQTILGALGDLSRFADGDHAASYLGLVPSTKQSAEHAYHGPITKAGNTHARWMLVEAAQHLGNNPGPLGAFFRRLEHKKNRNVAVVATARKLVTIAYLLLTRGEPYRYAMPARTGDKLRNLRLRSGGARRPTGCPKGTRPIAKLPDGSSRTIKPLATLYADEAVPGLLPPTAAEQSMINRNPAVAAFVASLAEPQVRPRQYRKPQIHAPSVDTGGSTDRARRPAR